jgi:hypothetical protein
MKARKQESIRYIVKWIVGHTMYFRAYKRDYAAIKFQEYLIEREGIDPFDIRVIMPKQ